MTSPGARTDVVGLAGLVLAAGAGRRMGTPKAQLVLGGRRMVDRQVELLAAAGCAPIVVVLGAVVVEVPGADVVVNPAWRQGMGSSLAAGLTRLLTSAPEVLAVAVVLVDQPALTAQAVRATAAAVTGDVPAARAGYARTIGHPVVLSRRVWADVAASSGGDSGARDWLERHAADVVTVACDGLGDDRDLDTREQALAWESEAG